jgi:1,4-dihydroxy-6-naphthoate synthase
VKLSIGFSPCPNDTFIFDAMVNGGIDTSPFHFEPVLADVETLNQWALEGRLDITKLSFPAFFASKKRYMLLDAGSALGKGVGPLLISKTAWETVDEARVNSARIAIPGLHTTANLLLSFAFPGAARRVPMIFSEIEEAVLQGKTDLGVIIHENRFTYQEKGLHRVMDLGVHWEEKMKVPVPLGGIAIRKSLGDSIKEKIEHFIRESLTVAWKNYPSVSNYVIAHSQEMSEEVMRQHINLYVNEYTNRLGEDGWKAVSIMRDVFENAL